MDATSLAEAVHRRLRAAGLTVACAESLTGGELAAMLSGPPGASAGFVGGVVTYATALKESLLSVPAELVATYGVVSGECAVAMAEGCRRITGADWAVSTTGVAGPDEQEDKPAGTVFVGVASAAGADFLALTLTGDRAGVRSGTCEAALEVLAERLP